MKKPAYAITALVLLICLSGCDDPENSSDRQYLQPVAEKPQVVEPKLSARTPTNPSPSYDNQDAAEDLDATGTSATPTPDTDSEKYDNDIGMPNPEAGDPVEDDTGDK